MNRRLRLWPVSVAVAAFCTVAAPFYVASAFARSAFHGIRTVTILGVALLALSFLAEASSAKTEVTTKFVSKKYGYEFVVPERPRYYRATDATMPWNLTIFPTGDSGVVDEVTIQDDRKFIAAATRLPTGTTLRKFQASYLALLQEGGVCKKAQALRNTTLGGVTAREFTIRCPGYDIIAAVAIHHGRGYFFQFLSPQYFAAASDRGKYEAGRRTFRFTSN